MYVMCNGKQSDQLLKLGGHSASLDRTNKMQSAIYEGYSGINDNDSIKLYS